MLSIGAMGGGQGGYYVGLAREDYYRAGGEPPGQWIGQGADALGLTQNGGIVDREAFLHLFQGVSPDGVALVQNAGKANRQPGWDLTFSAPKSVSALWACADGETRQVIQKAQFAAVREACRYLEEEHSITRRGKGGLDKEPAHLVIATFEHGTSRAQDPQLHTHSLVLNIAVRADSTTGAMESKNLYQAKMVAGAFYRAELAHQLEEAGFRVERTPGRTFAVQGIPRTLTDDFSKRRTEIEATLDERGQRGAKAAAVAALTTRQVKEHVAREELFGTWRATGVKHGFTEQTAQELRQGNRPLVAPFSPQAEREKETLKAALGAAVTAATTRLTGEASHFSEKDLLRAVLEEAPARGVWGSLARTAVRHELATNQEIITLGEVKGEKRYTTRELFEVEKQLLRDVDALHQGKGTRNHGVSELVLEQAIRCIEAQATVKATVKATAQGVQKDEPVVTVTLGGEQRKAVEHLTRETGGIAVLSGMAGTGKTLLLQAAREAWQRSGYTVVGAAVAGKAARGLEAGAGIKSVTVAKLLSDASKGTGTLDAKTILVVDEVGMVGTKQAAALVETVKNVGAKLVLVGDARQLQPVEVGGPFRFIAARVGQVELTRIRRQDVDTGDKNPLWKQEMVKDFAEGKAGKALVALSERGFLHIARDRQEAMQRLVERWAQQGASKPAENLIFAGTREDAQVLNLRAQAARQAAGFLGFRAVKVGGNTIHEKDRVLFTKRDTHLGVENGDLGTVKRVEGRSQKMVVALDRGGEAAIPLKEYEGMMLGYAMTTHKGQGMTVKNAFVLCGGSMTDRELSYVQASRAQQETHLFSEQIKVWDRKKETRVDKTVEQLAFRMSQSRQKGIAHNFMVTHMNQDTTAERMHTCGKS